MASIDVVIASFAASLALASQGKAPDLGKIGGGPVQKSSHAFLLGKPLTRHPMDSATFKSYFLRTWMVEQPILEFKRKGKTSISSLLKLSET
ncbi:hypothetical protein ACLB2K_004290 [Fragaria x ananassa]